MLQRFQQPSPAWLAKAQGTAFVVFAATSAFLTYFCMYAFRKPFTISTYQDFDQADWLITFKVALILAQVFGYLCAKLIGIKVVAEMTAARRGVTIFAMILTAELALILFALTPVGWNIGWLFVNGLSLGMIWGLVFSFLEGRRSTEILGAVLSVTFILASGIVRSVGMWLSIHWQIDELWLPAAVGAVFLPLTLLSLYCLTCVPAPTADDQQARQQRAPMDAAARWQFFKSHWFGISVLVLSFVLLTGFRDFRDNYSTEIWQALGYGQEPAIFTYAGIRIAGIVLLAMAALVMIKNNTKAFFANHLFILAGTLLLAGSTYAFEQHLVAAKTWMVLLGAGLYLSYIPYNCFLFDRMISAVGGAANAGFLIYLADSAGYLGSVGILLYRTFGRPDLTAFAFFVAACYWVALIAALLVLASLIYFRYRLRPARRCAEPHNNAVSYVLSRGSSS